MKRRPSNGTTGPLRTLAHREHGELAWALYVTEGHAAILRNRIEVNRYTLPRATLRVLRDALARSEATAAELRAAITERSERHGR